ncbi:MAG: hypothetical protein JWO48_670 [Bryobacterales bacterium]|nr:hypothetical protein [Bryobacterales bacterium]
MSTEISRCDIAAISALTLVFNPRRRSNRTIKSIGCVVTGYLDTVEVTDSSSVVCKGLRRLGGESRCWFKSFPSARIFHGPWFLQCKQVPVIALMEINAIPKGLP